MAGNVMLRTTNVSTRSLMLDPPNPQKMSVQGQHTPDFERFHSSLGLLSKSRVVQSRHCGSSERW